MNYSGSIAPLIAIICGALAWMVVAQMRYPEFTELDAHIRRALRTQPAVLRNQIAIRKTAAEFEQVASADQVWSCLTTLLGQLGFAEATCEFRIADAATKAQYAWQRALAPDSPSKQGVSIASGVRTSLWNVEIPITLADGGTGVVRLGRAFDRRAPLFRMESLVELVAQNMTAALSNRQSHQVQLAPAPAPAPPLAAAWKAAAGVRR